LKEALNLPSLEGVLISDVADNTPASTAGIKSGDVVLEFDGTPVKDVQSFRVQVASTPIGKTVKMKIFRDGEEKIVNVKIGEFPEELSAASEEGEEKSALGLKVVGITDAQAERFNLTAQKGVVVMGVESNSPAEAVDIRIGDVIIAIGKTGIKNVVDYRAALSKLDKFHIQRGERKLYIAVTP
jgi:serine protease Do